MARPDSDEPLNRLLSSRLRSHHAAAEVCPEPDLLAAFVDGSLDRSERSSVERHASSCSRCAQILAATEASAQTPVASSQPSIWTVWRVWRWAVPMATAVTVVGVWLAASRPGSPPPSAPAVKAPSATRPATSAGSVPQPAHEQQPAGLGSPAPGTAVARDTKPVERKDVEAPEAARVAPAAPPAVETARADRAAPERSAKLAKGEAPAAAASADTLRREEAAPAENLKERTRAARADAAVVLVRTTNPNVQWRGRGSTIERSDDGGATWRVERSVPGTIAAGSSPTPDVVWFVTRRGVIARRTASGWRDTVMSDVEMVSIRATSALQATIGLAGGGQIETADGGASWKAP